MRKGDSFHNLNHIKIVKFHSEPVAFRECASATLSTIVPTNLTNPRKHAVTTTSRIQMTKDRRVRSTTAIMGKRMKMKRPKEGREGESGAGLQLWGGGEDEDGETRG